MVDLKEYIIKSLTNNGFHILYVDPNWLYIDWGKKNKVQVPKVKKNNKKYKLIDEYKPSGEFINSQELSSIKDKTKQLF